MSTGWHLILASKLPDDPSDATAVVLRSLVESRQEAGEYLTMMQRIAADFENYRKRVERDHVENVTRASQRVVERLLPALDSFDAAIAYEAPSEGASKVLDGMRGTHAQLLEILADEGLEPIAAIGEPFDPAIHEAVAGPQGRRRRRRHTRCRSGAQTRLHHARACRATQPRHR